MVGRPRKLRDDSPVQDAPDVQQNVEIKKPAVTEHGIKKYYIGHQFGYIIPYLDNKDPKFQGVVKEKIRKDGKHYHVKMSNSEPRYKIIPSRDGIYKMVSIVSTGRGKLQRLACVFKTKGKKDRNKRDRSIISRLQKEGFPFSGVY